MFASRNKSIIASSLVLAVFLWGGNNAGVKHLVMTWPPVFVGGTRFLCAGLLLLAVLRWTRWLGRPEVLSRDEKRRFWWHGGLVLAVYIVTFNLAVHFTAVSHVALYLGASPVWALLWEGRRRGDGRLALMKRYGAAALALVGVVVLFWPTLNSDHASLPGELLGLLASVLWTCYGKVCRALGTRLSGAEITAHTMWRAGVLLLPVAAYELVNRNLVWRADLAWVQSYCIVAGGVISFALWNNALRHWRTSEVYLFNNLIPLSTMLWAHFCLGEAMTPTFVLAMVLVVSGVVIGQTNWQNLLGLRWWPAE